MSNITDVIITTGLLDGRNGVLSMDLVNRHLRHVHSDQHLVLVSPHAAGLKTMQCDVWMGAINYLDRNALIELCQAIEWEDPDAVTVLTRGENDERFAVQFVDAMTGDHR